MYVFEKEVYILPFYLKKDTPWSVRFIHHFLTPTSSEMDLVYVFTPFDVCFLVFGVHF